MDFGYTAHRRTVTAIAGMTLQGKPFVATTPTRILENRVNGRLKSITVLSDHTNTARAVARLDADTARY